MKAKLNGFPLHLQPKVRLLLPKDYQHTVKIGDLTYLEQKIIANSDIGKRSKESLQNY